MSKSYENKMMVNGSRVFGLVEVEQFAAQITQTNDHDSNQIIRQSDSSPSDGFRLQERTINLPTTGDSNVQGVHKVGVVEQPPAANSNSRDSAAFQPKNTTKSKRGEAVKSVTEWIIPSGTENKHSFVVSSLRRGVDPKVAFRHEDKSPKDPGTVCVNRKRRRYNRADTDKEMIHPRVAGVKFDKRFLRYGLSQCGEKKKEILVRVLPYQSPNCTQARVAWENEFMEQIPDEPSRTKTSSRIGPRYQTRIPSKSTCTNVPDKLSPGYDMLWDPKRATEAEQRGEDISSFLNGNHDFGRHELLHSTLHKNGYNVSLARMELEQMQRQSNAGSSSTFNEDEAKQFEALMRRHHKDISRVAKILRRKISDCLVHYYNWKASSRRYKGLKSQWNNQYCSVCQDGGLLIICDGCSLNFHMECVEPPLTAVPEGKWLCGSCKHAKRTGPSIYIGTHHSRKQPLTYESSSGTEKFSSEEFDTDEMSL